MVKETGQSINYFLWVLERIQTSRKMDTVSGESVVVYVYGSEPSDPPEKEQDNALKTLVHSGCIKILKTDYGKQISLKSGRTVKFVDDAPVDVASSGANFPYSKTIKIIKEKFNLMVSEYKILAEDDYIFYKFNPDELEGLLFFKKEIVADFSGARSVIVNYFYKNRDVDDCGFCFKQLNKYIDDHQKEKVNKLKGFSSKGLRDYIFAINKRVKKKTGEIDEIITKTDSSVSGGRNRYKWKIKFSDF